MKFKLTLLALLAFALGASAQVTPTIRGTFTNLPTTMPATTASNVNSQITLNAKGGIGFVAHVDATNAATANIGFYFQASVDGTNWSTTFPLNVQAALNGTTDVKHYTSAPPSMLYGANFLRVAYVTNGHSAPAFITNLTYSLEY